MNPTAQPTEIPAATPGALVPPFTTLPATLAPPPPAVDLAAVALPVLRRGNHDDLHLEALLASPLGRRMARKVARGQRLTFLLPAFPAKSSNRDKTHGPAPDLGELLGLRNLDAMCGEISRVYRPGAEVVICSDGRVFNDLVMVSDEDLELYTRGVEAIIEREGLRHLRCFSLDDCEAILGREHLREDLVALFGPEIEEIRAAAKASPERRSMLDGIHRFMKDDLGFHHPELSRNQLMLRSKKLAYQVVQRSQSWDNLLETVFPEALRLSIHPYPIEHRKFGVKLVAGEDRWATPWHNVTVKQGGRFRLMKRREALALGATLEFHGGEYAYYEIR